VKRKFRRWKRVYPTESVAQRVSRKYLGTPWKSGNALFVHVQRSFNDDVPDPPEPRNGHSVSWTTFFSELVARDLCVYYYAKDPHRLLHVGWQPGAIDRNGRVHR
jgi:hypothetical protein